MHRRFVLITVAALVLIGVSVIFLVPSDGQKVAKQPQQPQLQEVAQLQQTTPPPATPQMIFNDIWDKVNNRLMTTPWAGAQGTSQSETYILNDVWDEAGHFLRVSSSGGGGGGAGLPADPVACTTGQFVIDQNINGILACAQVSFANLSGVATDAQIPNLNTLSTGLTPSRCVETDGAGLLTSAGAACGAGGGGSGLPSDPVACPANQFVTDQSASGTLTCAQPSVATLSDGATLVTTARTVTINGTTNQVTVTGGTQDLTANRTWTVAIATSPTIPGTTTGTFSGPLTGNASTATALANDPNDCGANQFATTIAANGNLTCAQPAFTNISGAVTDAQVPNLNTLSTGLTASRCVQTDASGILVSAAGLCGVGDVSSNTSTSVDSEVALFSATTGKLIKRATGSGIPKLTAGVLSIAAAGTDYVVPAGNVATATALASDPSDCGVNQFATTIAANGNLTCAQPSSSSLSDAAQVVKTTTPQQLSNKQHIPREITMVPVADAITPDCDAADVVVVNAISATLTVNAPVCTLPGNPVPSQEIDFRFFCSAHQQIFWNGAFSTTAGVPYLSDCTGDGTTYDYAKVRRNSINSKWEFVATKAAGKGVTTVASATTLPCDAGVSTQCVMRNTAGAGTGIAISNPGGSPVDGQLMMWIVRCTAAQTITYGAKFVDSPNVIKPTSCSTDAQKYTMLGARYSLLDDLWQVIASN